MGSNENGRAFEYETVRLLLAEGFGADIKVRAAQSRDEGKLDNCPKDVADRIRKVAPVVVDWIRTRVYEGAGVAVERPRDSSGGVADIVLRRGNSVLLSVSLKFNHDALKHPRPYSLANSCGFPKDSLHDCNHRAAVKAAVEPLVWSAKVRSAGTFRELPQETQAMYDLVVQACASSLQSWIKSDGKYVADHLFHFIIGSGYYKLIAPRVEGKPIVVQDFTSVSTPSSVRVEANRSYLELFFNNAWHVRMRLHSASSKLNVEGNQISIKFDARREEGDVPTVEVSTRQ